MEHLERLDRQKNLAGPAPAGPRTRGERIHILLRKTAIATPRGSASFTSRVTKAPTRPRGATSRGQSQDGARPARPGVDCFGGDGAGGHAAILRPIWRRSGKRVLLYQFHDILPGSSITRVYDESVARYGELIEADREASGIDGSGSGSQYRHQGGQEAHGRHELALLGPDRMDRSRRQVAARDRAFAGLLTTLDGAAPGDKHDEMAASQSVLENDLLRVRFGADGYIASIPGQGGWPRSGGERRAGKLADRLSRRGRCVGFLHRLRASARRPVRTGLGHRERRWPSRRASSGAQVWPIDPDPTDYPDLGQPPDRLRHREANWQESERMLRVAFPVDVYATEANCEIQFGHLKRPNKPQHQLGTVQIRSPRAISGSISPIAPTASPCSTTASTATRCWATCLT